MIKKSYNIGEPNTVYSNLLKLLDKEAGRVGEFSLDGGMVYHIGDTTAILECFIDNDRMPDYITRAGLTLAASDIKIFNRDLEVFLGYVNRANPKYDISQIKEEK